MASHDNTHSSSSSCVYGIVNFFSIFPPSWPSKLSPLSSTTSPIDLALGHSEKNKLPKSPINSDSSPPWLFFVSLSSRYEDGQEKIALGKEKEVEEEEEDRKKKKKVLEYAEKGGTGKAWFPQPVTTTASYDYSNSSSSCGTYGIKSLFCLPPLPRPSKPSLLLSTSSPIDIPSGHQCHHYRRKKLSESASSSPLSSPSSTTSNLLFSVSLSSPEDGKVNIFLGKEKVVEEEEEEEAEEEENETIFVCEG